MKQIQQDVKQKTFRKVYLLYGEERYLRRAYQKMLTDALSPAGDDMNFSYFTEKNATEKAILEACETMPFFAPRRTVCIEDSGLLQRKSEMLADYIAKLPEYVTIVFSEPAVDKRNRLYKAIAKAGHIAEFPKQTQEMLSNFALQRIAKEGKKIKRADMNRLLEMTGADMGKLSQELEKLLCYTMGREIITAEDLDAIGSPEIKNQIFAMVRAVAKHDNAQALSLYHDLLALKEPPMRILYLLAREFHILYMIKDSVRRDSGALASMLGIPPFTVGQYQQIAAKYDKKRLRTAIEDIIASETAVKQGRLEDRLSVELFIVKYSQSEA